MSFAPQKERRRKKQLKKQEREKVQQARGVACCLPTEALLADRLKPVGRSSSFVSTIINKLLPVELKPKEEGEQEEEASQVFSPLNNNDHQGIEKHEECKKRKIPSKKEKEKKLEMRKLEK